MTSELRNLPSLDTLFGTELGKSRPPEVAELLDLFWPDCCDGANGQVLMHPADAEKVERMLELFGVPMRVSENSLAVLGHAYDVFVLGFGPVASRRLRRPHNFNTFYESWSPDWLAYIEAVATQDKVTARALAQKLQPLAPDCDYPPGVYVNGNGKDYPRDPDWDREHNRPLRGARKRSR